jgi:CRP-like cAMP-binding protein
MKEYLKLIGFFHDFSGAELDEFSAIAEVRTTRAMELVIREDEDGEGVYFIVKGDYEVVKNIGPGKYKRLQKLDRGDFFGEMSILNDEKHSATVISRAPGTLIFISKDSFNGLSDSNTRFSLKIMRELATILSRRLRRMNLKYGMSVAQLESKF